MRFPPPVDVQPLLGLSLRDTQKGREGRIVGVDQAQATPVLWVCWAPGQGSERLELTREQFEALLAACRPQDAPASRSAAEPAAGDSAATAEEPEPRRQAARR
ncbi:hypothetical protein [Halomonas sp. NCCP-2165]|nr:hypothetical protein [Halomonas sp. NCCP-2165]